jgi:hypothetical protein
MVAGGENLARLAGFKFGTNQKYNYVWVWFLVITVTGVPGWGLSGMSGIGWIPHGMRRYPQFLLSVGRDTTREGLSFVNR